jgi:hypothetical protein
VGRSIVLHFKLAWGLQQYGLYKPMMMAQSAFKQVFSAHQASYHFFSDTHLSIKTALYFELDPHWPVDLNPA